MAALTRNVASLRLASPEPAFEKHEHLDYSWDSIQYDDELPMITFVHRPEDFGIFDFEAFSKCSGDCSEVSKSGILFLGSSEVRRLYVRMLTMHLGLTNHESELLQNKAKVEAHDLLQEGLNKFRENDDVIFDLIENASRLRYRVELEFNANSIHEQIVDAYRNGMKLIYYGFPTPHLLYGFGRGGHDGRRISGIDVCGKGKDFPKYIEATLDELMSKLKVSFPFANDRPQIILGNGIMYAHDRISSTCSQSQTGNTCDSRTCGQQCDCQPESGERSARIDHCEQGACDYMQDNAGLSKVNTIFSKVVKKFSYPFVHFFDMQKVTADTENHNAAGFSDGNVHYLYPILDNQLTRIFKTFLSDV